VKVSFHSDSFDRIIDVTLPGGFNGSNELLFVSLKMVTSFSVLIKSDSHDSLDLFWVNGEVEVHGDLWKGVLEHRKLIEGEHGDDVVSVWVVVIGHVDVELWDDISELDSININVHGDVLANVVHDTDINLLLTVDKVFPHVEVLVDNSLLVLLPSEPESIEIGVTGGVLSLDIVPPSPDIMIIPFE